LAVLALTLVGGGGAYAFVASGEASADRAAEKNSEPAEKQSKKKNGKKKQKGSAKLKQPKLGLTALDRYEKPTSAHEASIRSATYWRSVSADFEQALQQDGAPERWKAAQAFADGQVHLQSGEPAKAIPRLDAAMAADSDWPFPHTAKAGALLWLGRDDEALAAAQSAERLDPEWWWAPAVVGSVLSHTGRTDDAIAAFKRALALSPKQPVLLGGLASVYHGARLDTEAERYAKLALAEDENTVLAHLVLAERALLANDGEVALRHATRAVSVVPDHITGLVFLGDAHALLGKDEEALASYEKAVAIWEEKHERLGPSARMPGIREAVKKKELPPRASKPKPAPAAAPGPTPGRGSPGKLTTPSGPVFPRGLTGPDARGNGDVNPPGGRGRP
jgi:tetratricopeptide (TPR) repeat protein